MPAAGLNVQGQQPDIMQAAHLAAGVGAPRPVHADFLGQVQLRLQLLHDGHGPVLGLDHRDAAELGARAADQAPRQLASVDQILLEDRLLRHEQQVSGAVGMGTYVGQHSAAYNGHASLLERHHQLITGMFTIDQHCGGRAQV